MIKGSIYLSTPMVFGREKNPVKVSVTAQARQSHLFVERNP